ncbi:hypothetical protein [Amycolatopsis alkalitolerans]|uniref:Uncharacterized protein n=1 Tax=Amycolatopsis alkalitolerans TaxID=2547244 RepID=A0A5C4LYP1_9PSEU|nr:hypothetical protein [Amycolatopsis alkalitolerans]TNC22223.1 hypothetical protein FG385_25940 [Amycolatopsis alkalitolerans]
MAERVEVVRTTDAVRLRRLLQIAKLTPPQAHFLAREITAAAMSSHAADLESVFVDQYGDVVVAPGADPDGLAGVLRVLAAVAGQDGTPLRAAAEAAAAGAGPAAILSIVDEVPLAPERPLAEVSALVRAAIGHEAPPPARPSPAPLAAPESARRPKLRATLRPLWRALAALLVLAAAVVAEFVFLHDHIAGDLNLLLGGEKPAAPPPQAVPAPLLPVTAPAPASAGPVSGVDLRALQPCDPATTCDVRILVRLLPPPAPVTVRWEFQVTDRCTGTRTTVPGGSVVAGGTGPTVVGQVPLPAARALAVHVVTTSPARATGAPLLLGATSC